jgi:hypothetical protein
MPSALNLLKQGTARYKKIKALTSPFALRPSDFQGFHFASINYPTSLGNWTTTLGQTEKCYEYDALNKIADMAGAAWPAAGCHFPVFMNLAIPQNRIPPVW